MAFSSYLQNRIVLTLAYSNSFDFPLAQKELYHRLITATFVPLVDFTTQLSLLEKKGTVVNDNGYYRLKKYKPITELRKQKEAYSEQKIKEAHNFIGLISRVPWIKAVALTGSVAVKNAKADDDIDFLIITDNNRLWLTRIVVSLIAQLKKKRRTWGKEEKNSWCFNLWLEKDTVSLPKRLHTLYGAYELCQAEWIFQKSPITISNFYKLNIWAKQFVHHLFKHRMRQNSSTLADKSSWSFSFFNLLNWCAYLVQRLYMNKHITMESVSLHSAFFHPRDTKGDIYQKWREILMYAK